MLSIARIKGKRSIDYYVRVASEGYYLQGLSREHQWVGTGATSLGLTGACNSEMVQSLLHGLHPHDGRELCQNSGKVDRTAGWDLTFSAPKGVSVLWALGPKEVRDLIEEAHLEAVRRTMDFLERNVAVGRRGRGGEEIEPVQLVGVEVRHFTSRENDPQIHSHLLVANVGVRGDGTTGGIESRPFFLAKLVAGSHYRAHLWAILQDKLQVELRDHGYGYEVVGLTDSLLREFSQRRIAIDENLEETGGVSSRAKDVSTLVTRAAKEDMPLEVLERDWVKRALERGLHRARISDVLFNGKRTPRRKELLRALIGRSDAIARRSGGFTRLELLRVAFDKAPGAGLSVKEAEALVDKYLARSRDIIRVPGNGPDYYTTRAVVRCERELTRLVSQDLNKVVRGVRDRAILDCFPFEDPRSAALSAVLSGPGRVVFLDGIAGGGKTSVLKSAHDIWSKNKMRVLGVAPTAGEATSLMAVEGIPSVSVQQFLLKPTWPLEDGATPEVLVLDNANSIDNFTLVELLRRAERGRCKVVAVGDVRGVAPRMAGGGFEVVTQKGHGATLSEAHRSINSTDKKAVELLRAGEVRPAISALLEEERIHVLPTRQEVLSKVAQDYLAIAPRYIKSAVLCGSDKDVQVVNQHVQRILLENDAVDKKFVRFRGKRFYQGELIVIKRSSKLYGVRAGDRASLVAVHPLLGYVKLSYENGAIRHIPTKFLEHVDHGYAFNILKYPQLVCDQAFIVVGGDHQHLELTYRQLSRATESSHLYCDETEAGKGLSEMIRQSSRSRQKHLTLVTSGTERGNR